jgi:hypothetical protein
MIDLGNSHDPQHPDAASTAANSQVSITSDLFALVAAQLIVVALLSPGDGGRWLRYVATTLIGVDIVAYFAFISGGRPRRIGLPVTALTLLAVTIVVAVIVTYTIDWLDLP